MIGICALSALRKLARQMGHALAASPACGAQPHYDAASAAAKLAEYEQFPPGSQLTAPAPRGVAHAFVLPSARFRSPSTGLPVATPCGRGCAVAVVVFSRLTPPRRTMVWCCLPCTVRQAVDEAARAGARGLLSAEEVSAVHALLGRLDGRLPACGEKGPS
jgi:hypothetical protein